MYQCVYTGIEIPDEAQLPAAEFSDTESNAELEMQLDQLFGSADEEKLEHAELPEAIAGDPAGDSRAECRRGDDDQNDETQNMSQFLSD